MAYDALVVCATVSELCKKILNGSIMKVAQPEKDELLFTVKVSRRESGSSADGASEPVTVREQLKLTLSANPSLPMVCLREDAPLSQKDAPNFCMVLRKHIGGGRITKVEQGGEFERIIIFTIEHMDEMGDRCERKLICELMGKHSNIILTKDDGTIIDSIKHISAATSSLREILPGRKYFIPETGHAGLGKVMDEEICYRAGADSRIPYRELPEPVKEKISEVKEAIFREAKEGKFCPNIVYYRGKPCEYAAIRLDSLTGEDYVREEFASISEVVRTFYERKSVEGRIRAKSEDIRLLLKNLTERTAKKLDLQEKQFLDTKKRDRYRIYGELLNTYGYSLSGGEKELRCENYYDGGKEITIPLDEHRTAAQNAKNYFDRYQKLKRTEEALSGQIRENREILYHLDSLKNALSLSENEADLRVIREEMETAGFSRRKPSAGKKERIRKEEVRSAPLHFVSSDGVDLYVGRNNAQNEELTFRISDKDDWWFHAKNIPGSHVIARTGKAELPDATCREAAALAAYYSKAGREQENALIEVDYVRRKELRKVPGAAPGFVIYHTNYSIMIEPKSEL